MSTEDATLGKISLGSLPSGLSVVFKESTFFTHNGPNSSLPSPAEVRANNPPGPLGVSIIVRFEALNLLVKYGKEETIAEGQCLWALHRLLPQQVPVPEVYGWCQEGKDVFIYMELIKGVTLEYRWDALVKEERLSVCNQLRAIVAALRTLQQDPEDQFLGHINRQPLLDIVFTDSSKPSAGPFASVKEFHDWLSYMIKRGKEIHWPDPSKIPDP